MKVYDNKHVELSATTETNYADVSRSPYQVDINKGREWSYFVYQEENKLLHAYNSYLYDDIDYIVANPIDIKYVDYEFSNHDFPFDYSIYTITKEDDGYHVTGNIEEVLSTSEIQMIRDVYESNGYEFNQDDISFEYLIQIEEDMITLHLI